MNGHGMILGVEGAVAGSTNSNAQLRGEPPHCQRVLMGTERLEFRHVDREDLLQILWVGTLSLIHI